MLIFISRPWVRQAIHKYLNPDSNGRKTRPLAAPLLPTIPSGGALPSRLCISTASIHHAANRGRIPGLEAAYDLVTAPGDLADDFMARHVRIRRSIPLIYIPRFATLTRRGQAAGISHTAVKAGHRPGFPAAQTPPQTANSAWRRGPRSWPGHKWRRWRRTGSDDIQVIMTLTATV